MSGEQKQQETGRSPAVRAGNSALLEPPVRYDNLAQALRAAREKLGRELGDDGDPDPYGYMQEAEVNYGFELLPAQWKAAPDDGRWIKRLKARQRRAIVARWYMAGYPVAEIARRAKVSDMTVYHDLHRIEAEWRDSYLADIEVLATRDLARLDMMFSKLFSKIEKGDGDAIAAGLKIIQERGAILGYRQGLQIDLEAHIRAVAAANGFDPDEAVQVAAKISVNLR